MTWNFDMSSIPRGPDIWIETAGGEVVRTRFIQASKTVKEGFWAGVGSEDRIICWQPFVRPAATGLGKRIEPISATDRHRAAADLAQIMTGIPGSEFLPEINDVGGE